MNNSLLTFESENYVEKFTIKILWQLIQLFVFIAGITCPGLPSPTNGTRLGCSGNATEFYDTVCQFECNNGYVGSGSQIRRCQENRTWSGEEFVCQSTSHILGIVCFDLSVHLDSVPTVLEHLNLRKKEKGIR